MTNLLYNRSSGSPDPEEDREVPQLLSRPVRPQLHGSFPSLPPRAAAGVSSGASETAAAAVAAARKEALEKLQAQLDGRNAASDVATAGGDSDSAAGSRGGVSEDGTPESGVPDSTASDSGFPFAFAAALNSVLYQRHGYQRMKSHGNPL